MELTSQPNLSTSFLQSITSLPLRIFSSIMGSIQGSLLATANLVLQSLAFSLFAIKAINLFFQYFRFHAMQRVTNSYLSYIAILTLFLWKKLTLYFNKFVFFHSFFRYFTTFYVTFYAIEGCRVWVKGCIPSKEREKKKKETKYIEELFLIIPTFISITFFCYLWNNIQIIKQISNSNSDYSIFVILLAQIFILFLVSIFANVSLIFPSILSLIIEAVIGIRIFLAVYMNPGSQSLQQLSIPFEIMPILIFAAEGQRSHILEKQKQGKQSNCRSRSIQQKIEIIEASNSMCTWYFIYTGLHGDLLSIEYFFLPTLLVLLLWRKLF